MKKIPIPKLDYKKIISAVIGKLKIIAVVLIVALIVGFGWFLYGNFYETIVSAREIVLLEGEVSGNTVSIHDLQRIEKEMQKKTTLEQFSWGVYRRVFTDEDRQVTSGDEVSLPLPTTDDVQPVTSF